MIEIRCPPAKFHFPPELFVFARKKGVVLDYSCWTSDLAILGFVFNSEILIWRGRVSNNGKITLIPIPIPKTNGSSDNRGSAGGSPTSGRPGLAILGAKFNSEVLCGEVGFPTTGIFNNFLTLSHRQIAMDAVGNQRAEARPL